MLEYDALIYQRLKVRGPVIQGFVFVEQLSTLKSEIDLTTVIMLIGRDIPAASGQLQHIFLLLSS